MKPFLDKDFLLTTKTAARLYHDVAAKQPIIDYHCHLPVKDIAEDRTFDTITRLWLEGDHYKWRAMRSNGIEERLITGDADDREKFRAWASTVPRCIGNPLYHWTHLELRRTFGIELLLSEKSADEIYDRCNAFLQSREGSVRSLILAAGVESLCTTDDPCDSLEHHIRLAGAWTGVKVLPTFRPDKAIDPHHPEFLTKVLQLEQLCGFQIDNYEKLEAALINRMEFFHSAGCRLSDHGLEPPVCEPMSLKSLNKAVKKVLKSGKSAVLSSREGEAVRTALLVSIGAKCRELDWVMQYHIGTIRNNNSRMMSLIGADTGFDSIGDASYAKVLANLLDAIESRGSLPKTILYCLNPSDNEMIATLAGCFQGGGIPGKIQFGSGWWFNDQKDGMIRQMTALANLGLLSRFVGMLTDSRSFISYPRHEYFRRILCRLIGEWVEAGEFPNDRELLQETVTGICSQNARDYFRF